MSGYDKLFPASVMSRLTDMIESRTVSASDIINRRQQVLPHFKVATASELAEALIGSLHSLPDSEKRLVIAALQRTVSDDVDNAI